MGKAIDLYVTSSLGVDYRFDVYDDNYSGSTITAKANDFELSYTPSDDSLVCPIITSTLRVNFYDDGTAGLAARITSIEESDEPEVKVAMYIDEGSGYTLNWVGIVEKRSLVRKDEPTPRMFVLEASDGLSRLKDIRYPGIANGTHTGSSPLAQFITECLSENALSGFWGTSDPYLIESIEWVSNEVLSPGMADSPLLYTRCNVLHFRDNSEGDSDEVPKNKSCWEVIEAIMQLFGAQILHANGGYYIRQPRNFASTSHIERRINKLLSSVSSSSVSNDTARIAPTTTSTAGYFHVMAGNEFSRREPLDKVRAVYKPKVLLNYENPTDTPGKFIDNSDKDYTWTYPLGTVRGGSGSGKYIVFSMDFAELGGKWEYRVEITIELPGGTTYWLDYNPTTGDFSWNTSLSSYVYFRKPTGSGMFGLRDNLWRMRFTTPEIPASLSTAAEIEVTVQFWDRGTGAQPSNVGDQRLYCYHPEVALRGENAEDQAEREVEVDNGLSDTNSRVLDLGVVWFNDEAIISTQNEFEINESGSTWVANTTWDCGFDTDVSLVDSMMLERMMYQQYAVEIYRGRLEGFMRPHLSIIYDSTTYVMRRFTWMGKMDEAEGEWWELKQAISGISIGDERVVKTPDISITKGRGGQGDTFDKRLYRLERIGELGAQYLITGGTITSISLLNQIGHDHVRAGDTIAIVSPLTGEILHEFTASVDAVSTATSISVTSDTPTYDLNVGDIVMHKFSELKAADTVRAHFFQTLGEQTDADAPAYALYYSSDQAALCYKDSLGAVHTIDMTSI